MQIAGMEQHWIIAIAAALLVVCHSPDVIAGERASGDQIQQLLTGRTVAGIKDGRAWRQTFFEGGSTVYVDRGDRESRGRWQVRANSYCSQWPPGPRWACYDVELEPDGSIAFVSAFGDRWPARLQ